MTPIELIDETVTYYTEDVSRRATNDTGGCNYITEDGRMCAVGRCVENPQGDWGFTAEAPFAKDKLIFKPEYTGLSFDLWGELQILHDRREYWDENGLTEDGEEYVQQLKAKYGV